MRLDRLISNRAGDDRGEKTSAVAHQHHLLRSRHRSQQFFLNRFRSDVVAGIQNDQILQPSRNAPVSCGIHFALIAGVKPAIAQHRGRLLRPAPVAGKNIRSANEDFAILAHLHFNPGNRRSHAPWFDSRRIVHRADGRSFREAVDLQHGNSQHHEKQLRLAGQRRGAANQRAQIRSQPLADRGKDQQSGEPQPEKIPRLWRLIVQPRPCGVGALKDLRRSNRRVFACCRSTPARMRSRSVGTFRQ